MNPHARQETQAAQLVATLAAVDEGATADYVALTVGKALRRLTLAPTSRRAHAAARSALKVYAAYETRQETT